MENYSGQSATELDSHANMAVAGANVSIISKSGLVATVTPFSDDLPPMDDVEIGDVAIAYDDPRTGVTYILIIRNALLIPTMSHNLIPPFLIREAGLMRLPRYMQLSRMSLIIRLLIMNQACISIWTLMGSFHTFPLAN